MGKYTKFFNKESEYNSFRNTSKYILPNVSYTDDTETVHFNPKVSIPKVAIATLRYNATADNLLALNRANNISALRIDGVNIEIAPAAEGEKIYDIEGSQITITDYDNFYIECPMSYFLTDVVSEIRFKAKDTNAVPAYVCLIAIDSGIMMATPIPMELLADMDITFDANTNEFIVGKDLLGEMNPLIQEGFHFNFTLMDENAMFLDTEVYTKTTIGGLELPYYFASEGEHVVEIETESGIFGGTNMFAGSTLYSVKFNEAITMVEDYTFTDCTNLPVINNIRYADTYLVEAVDKTMSSYVMKSTTKWIGSNAFSGCTNWTDSLVIPNTVVSIGSYAFSNCSGLTDNLLIPRNVTYIGAYAFNYCTGLTGDLVLPRYITSINEYAFGGCYSLTGNLIIPSSVTNIDYGAFIRCSGLTGELVIPDSVTMIDGYAFAYCSGLTSIVIPESLTSIGYYAFSDCYGLTGNLNIPDSITTIDVGAFTYCSGLTSLSLGSGLTSIGSSAFCFCKNLRYITSHAVIAPQIDKSTFDRVAKNGILDYPNGSDYSQWLSTDVAYLGYYNWNLTEVTLVCVYDVTGTTASTKLCNYATGFTDIIVDGVSIGTGSTGYTFSTTGEHTVEFKMESYRIEDRTFRYCYNLTSIVIPKPIRYINNYAFQYCHSLTSIDIPDSVTSIGYNAFENCNSLSSIVIPDSVTSIGSDAFNGCSGLSSIVIPDSVTSIGSDAFNGCTSLPVIGNVRYADTYLVGAVDKTLSSYTIKNGTKWIGSNAFSGCENWAGKLSIPNTVIKIESLAFSSCSGLTGELVIPNSVSSIGAYAFTGCKGLTGELLIPNSVTNIGALAFGACSGFTGELIIPGSVKRIESLAFSGCTGIISIDISDSVTYIGGAAFGCCPSVETITVSKGNLNYHSKGDCLIRWNNVLIAGCKNSVIPNTVTGISGAFYYCYSLTSIDIPNSVISIESESFTNCTGLTSLSLGSGVITIGNYAFKNCSGLTSDLILPNSVTSIGDSAFNNCKGLASLSLGSGVTSIDSSAFGGCSSLTGITVSTENTVYDSRNNCNCLIKTNTNTLLLGCNNSVIPNSVTSIGSSAFYGCSGLTSIDIPNSVTSIGYHAFYECYALTGELVIHDSVTSIDYGAFGGCTGLTSVTLGSGLTSIGSSAFSGCSGLTEITCNAVTAPTISNNTFSGVSYYGTLNYPEGSDYSKWLKTDEYYLGYYAWNKDKLTIITCTYNVTDTTAATKLWESNWYQTHFANIIYNETSIEDTGYTFNTTGEHTVIFVLNNDVIDEYAFSGCYNLKSVDISKSVTEIGSSAFRNCSGLTSITCHAVNTPIIGGNQTFYGVKQNGTLYYPSGSNYSTWLSTSSYYLGYYNWTSQTI